MKKVMPGEFGYYNYKRNKTIILTFVYFALSIALYIIGYVTTGSNKNLLTIIAVLGMLPSSKSAVSMIMYLRYHGCSQENYELLKDTTDLFSRAYGLVFTTYKRNYEVAVCIVKNGYVYALLTNHTEDGNELQKHISDMIRQNGLKGTVGVFTKSDEYIKRLKELSQKEDENKDNDESLLTLVHQLSL